MTILDRALGRPRTILPDPGGSRAGGRSWSLAWEPHLRLRPVLILAAVAGIVVGLVSVVQSSDATRTNFAIQQLEQERLGLQTRVQEMEAEVAALQSLNRVEQEARGRLGFVPGGQPERVEVGLPLPEQRQLPGEGAAAGTDDKSGGSSWWRRALKLLPFR
jgi:cell division protein FtsL